MGKGKSFSDINCTERARKFQELFSPPQEHGIQTSLFDRYDHRESRFERYCKGINGLFNRWRTRGKAEYLRTFSLENWKRLSKKSKRRHTFENCKECALAYPELQQNFPGPIFHLEQSLAQQVGAIVEQNSAAKAPEQSTTRQVLAELELTYQQA